MRMGKTPTNCGEYKYQTQDIVFSPLLIRASPSLSCTNCKPEISIILRRISPTPRIS